MHAIHAACSVYLASICHRSVIHDAQTVGQFNESPTAMQGFWRIAIYNPMLVYQIGYNLTAVKVAHCLNNCSGHGQCDSNGVCQCEGNWAGGDCSVNKDGDCQVNILHPLPPAGIYTFHMLSCSNAAHEVSCRYHHVGLTCERP